MFSCKHCEIFKNIYLDEQPRTVVFVNSETLKKYKVRFSNFPKQDTRKVALSFNDFKFNFLSFRLQFMWAFTLWICSLSTPESNNENKTCFFVHSPQALYIFILVLLVLGLTNREQIMSPECSKHQEPRLAKILVVNEQKIFCSHQCSPECSMNKFRAYISTYTCFILPSSVARPNERYISQWALVKETFTFSLL